MGLVFSIFIKNINKWRNTIGDYINTMKITFLILVWNGNKLFQITSLQVIKEKPFNWQLLFTSVFVYSSYLTI